MVKYCAVVCCKNTHKNKDVTFHAIPTNPYYRATWLRICRKQIKCVQHATICSDHFSPECFKPRSATAEFMDKALNRTSRKLTKLHSNAIPTENLPARNGKSDAEAGSVSVDSNESTVHADVLSSPVVQNNSNDILAGESSSNESAVERSNNVSASDSATNASASGGSSEASNGIINYMFSSLPTSQEEHKIYVEKLLQIKKKMFQEMQDLQKDVERQKQLVKEEKRKNLEKDKKHREQCEAFLLRIFQLKDREIAWKQRYIMYINKEWSMLKIN